MSASKKTIIKIKNLDEPEKNRKDDAPAKKTGKKKAAKPAEVKKADIRAEMQKKFAGVNPDNWDDLAEEKAPDTDKADGKAEPAIDLSEKGGSFAAKIREKLNSLGSVAPAINDGDEQADESVLEAAVPIAKREPAEEEDVKVETPDQPATGGLKIPIEETAGAVSEKPKVSLKLYRNIAIFFIIGTIAVLSAVFYFTAVKLTIVVTPKEEMLSENLLFAVKDKSGNSENSEAISGIVESVILEKNKTYPATGSKVIGEDAVGKVVLKNNYVKNQPLVATTRLLSPDGVLFRLKETVNVPAGGTVEAEIYADKPSADIYVPPAKFTIPGLWAGIQDDIFAESQETIKYEQITEKSVQQSDIDSAAADLKKELIAEAKSKINDLYKEYSRVIYEVDESSITQGFNAKAGDKADEVNATMKATVAVIAFNDDPARGKAREKISTVLPAGKTIVFFNDASMTYKLDNYNLVEKSASVFSSFEASVVASDLSSLIDKTSLIGLSEKQLNTYMSGLTGIKSYELRFNPEWLKVVPRLADKIEIKIK